MTSDRTVTRDNGNQRVNIGLRPGETVDDVERDFGLAFDLGHEMVSSGTQEYLSWYRWIGPVKVLAYKEVGPPPWRWPRVGIQPSRTGKPFVRFIIGWRSTAYALCFLWAGRHAGR